METTNQKTLTEDEKKVFKNEVKKRIRKMRFTLGAKTSTALEFLLIQKAITGKTIKELAPECQREMHKNNPRYMERAGDRFLEELEDDLDENAEREKRLPKEIFHTGFTIENLSYMRYFHIKRKKIKKRRKNGALLHFFLTFLQKNININV